jgi:hypothetical protein
VHSSASSSPRAAPSEPAIESPRGSPLVLPAIVLLADLTERPSGWQRVLFIPFGRDRSQLGYQTFPDTVASQPSAFVAASDGSFWIDDRWKTRVAHYSLSGRFLGSVRGLERPGWDLAMVGDQLFVLVEQESGTVGTVRDNRVQAAGMTHAGQPLFLVQLVPTVRGLVGQAALVSGTEAGVFGSFVALDPSGAREAYVLPGLPLGSGDTYADARLSEGSPGSRGDQDFDIIFTSPQVAQTQPIRIDLIAHDDGGERSIPAQVGLREPLAVGEDVLVYVDIAPTRPRDADRFGGGHWLLRLGRSPLLWERVPGPRISSELQHRHFAVGPNGEIYLMVAGPSGVTFYRRRGIGA